MEQSRDRPFLLRVAPEIGTGLLHWFDMIETSSSDFENVFNRFTHLVQGNCCLGKVLVLCTLNVCNIQESLSVVEVQTAENLWNSCCQCDLEVKDSLLNEYNTWQYGNSGTTTSMWQKGKNCFGSRLVWKIFEPFSNYTYLKSSLL